MNLRDLFSRLRADDLECQIGAWRGVSWRTYEQLRINGSPVGEKRSPMQNADSDHARGDGDQVVGDTRTACDPTVSDNLTAASNSSIIHSRDVRKYKVLSRIDHHKRHRL